MVSIRQAPSEIETPASDLSAFLIGRHYVEIGCDRWDTRRVQLLCAKFGDTPTIMAARLRLRFSEFKKRMETDCWTKQDGLILTILEREMDLRRGLVEPSEVWFSPTPDGGSQ
jgi:hypothetical protein